MSGVHISTLCEVSNTFEKRRKSSDLGGRGVERIDLTTLENGRKFEVQSLDNDTFLS